MLQGPGGSCRYQRPQTGSGLIYNPSGANQLFAQQYEKLLIDLMEFDLDQIFLVGDYNINVASPTPFANVVSLHQIHTYFWSHCSADVFYAHY